METASNNKRDEIVPEEDTLFSLIRGANLDLLKKLEMSSQRLERKSFDGHCALMLAVYCGHRDIVSYLLEVGADPNVHDRDETTVLMAAAFKGDPAVIKALLLAGADPFAKNLKCQTALEFAVNFGHLKAAFLIKLRSLELEQRNKQIP